MGDEIISISKIVIVGVTIFYRPFQIHQLKVFLGKKIFDKENEFLPESLKLSQKEAENNFFNKSTVVKISKVFKKLPMMMEKEDKKEEKKIRIANIILKNGEENFEFIDEMKMNIVTNCYLESKLTDFQNKLLPLAVVNKRAKEEEDGGVNVKKEERNIYEILKKFKERPLDEDECEEIKNVRNYILENIEYIEEELK